jgi:hypothetical protein
MSLLQEFLTRMTRGGVTVLVVHLAAGAVVAQAVVQLVLSGDRLSVSRQSLRVQVGASALSWHG